MVIDVEALLAPVSDGSPVGADLDGTAERYAIEEPFQLEANAGDEDELDIDWRDTVRRIVAQFAETKDLWLAIYLMRAGARLGDFDTVVGGAQTAQALLERYWETVHPQLEMVDFIGRKAPFESLTKLRDFLNPLRQVILVQHSRLGRYTIGDVERMARDGPGADGYGMFQAALADMGAGEIAGVRDRVLALITAIRGIDATLTSRAVEDTSTNFELTYRTLEEIRAAVDQFAYVEPEAAPADGGGVDDGLGDFDFGDLDALLADVSGDSSDGGGSHGGGEPEVEVAVNAAPVPVTTAAPVAVAVTQRGTAPRRPGGPPQSRAEAMQALQAVESYYRTNEPGSPIIALMVRARAWADMDFITLLQDMSPETLNDAKRVLGVKDDGY